MRIVVDIGHPGHVHFFKHFIWEMEKLGHEIRVTATDKEMTYALLDHYKIPYIRMGKHVKSLAHKLVDIPVLDMKMYRALKKFKPDLFMGIASYRAAQTAKLFGAKSFIFDDTEHAKMARRLYLPFATKVFTPSCFLEDIGPKQVRYNGYHELAYLHPNRFKPDASVLEEIGVAKSQKYAIIRFVAWTAGHDAGHAGLSSEGKKKIVEAIAENATAVITSEGRMPEDLKKYQIKIKPWRIHDALAFASLYVGEGATMASEAAMLGTPAVYVNDLNAGTLADQAKNGLLFNLRIAESVMRAIASAFNEEDAGWQRKREEMLSEKIDVTEYLISQAINKEGAVAA
jgi:predicted glycosyltransferase